MDNIGMKKIIDCMNDNKDLMKSGIYGFFLCNECIYVGQARNLFYRLLSHLDNISNVKFLKNDPSNTKYKYMSKYFSDLSWRVLEYTKILDDRENYWINYYDPIFNIIKSNRTYNFIGSDKDIDDFVLGLNDMSDLQKLKIPKRKILDGKQSIILNSKWLNKPLNRNARYDLCAELCLSNSKNGKKLSWSSIKTLLIKSGYSIINKNIHEHRYTIISNS